MGVGLLEAGGYLRRDRPFGIASGVEGRPLHLSAAPDFIQVIGGRVAAVRYVLNKLSRDMGRRSRVDFAAVNPRHVRGPMRYATSRPKTRVISCFDFLSSTVH